MPGLPNCPCGYVSVTPFLRGTVAPVLQGEGRPASGASQAAGGGAGALVFPLKCPSDKGETLRLSPTQREGQASSIP